MDTNHLGFDRSDLISALCYSLARANRTTIRDANFSHTAMFYKPMIDVLRGEEGVISISRHQIKNHNVLKNRGFGIVTRAECLVHLSG
jgi:hypothetical protein